MQKSLKKYVSKGDSKETLWIEACDNLLWSVNVYLYQTLLGNIMLLEFDISRQSVDG